MRGGSRTAARARARINGSRFEREIVTLLSGVLVGLSWVAWLVFFA